MERVLLEALGEHRLQNGPSARPPMDLNKLDDLVLFLQAHAILRLLLKIIILQEPGTISASVLLTNCPWILLHLLCLDTLLSLPSILLLGQNISLELVIT